MRSDDSRSQQAAFAIAAAQQLRQARLAQHLTQAQVSSRTGGVISKAALANYEAGHRSLRVEVFWALAKALAQDAGALLNAADRAVGFAAGGADGPVTVDVEAITHSEDIRLAPIRRWFAMRLQASGSRIPVRTIVLDGGAVAALAELAGVSVAECRQILAEAGAPDAQPYGTPDAPAHSAS